MGCRRPDREYKKPSVWVGLFAGRLGLEGKIWIGGRCFVWIVNRNCFQHRLGSLADWGWKEGVGACMSSAARFGKILRMSMQLISKTGRGATVRRSVGLNWQVFISWNWRVWECSVSSVGGFLLLFARRFGDSEGAGMLSGRVSKVGECDSHCWAPGS